MPGKASSLVSKAKKWASYYGRFPNGEEGAVLSVPLRVRAAWENNDADALADVFTENGSLLMGDEQLRGREEIRSYMAKAFSGEYRGVRVVEEPIEIKFLSGDVAMAISEGGTLAPGETEPAPEREMRTTWVIVKQNGEWRLLSHQGSPVKG